MTRIKLNALLLAAAVLGGAFSAHAGEAREITVFKSPSCGCCENWSEALRTEGYTVKTRDLEDLSPVKRPLQAIDKLLEERPEIRGIATPSMPIGSLGMGYDEDARYTVYSYSADAGEPKVFYEAGQ
mgnify:CR=1 FL=1